VTRIARKLALTAIAGGVPAAPSADADPVNLRLTDDVRADLVQAGAVLTGGTALQFRVRR
jgi:hypothetical protein